MLNGTPRNRSAGALVELAAELAVGDIELEQAVAGWQRHVVDLGRVPGRDDVAARIRLGPDRMTTF
jgi:hypothetical protein